MCIRDSLKVLFFGIGLLLNKISSIFKYSLPKIFAEYAPANASPVFKIKFLLFMKFGFKVNLIKLTL